MDNLPKSPAQLHFTVTRSTSWKRRLAFSLLWVPLAAFAAGPPPRLVTAGDGRVAFEVATIKPSRPGVEGNSVRVRGRRFESTNTSLSELIAFAYDLHAKQITEAPAWVVMDKYDLEGEAGGEGQPSEAEWREMVRRLIEERFKLSSHSDKKQLSVYVLSADGKGPRLTRSEGDPNGLPSISLGTGSITAINASMRDLAGVMQRTVLDRPVIDQTELSGRFDFSLTWTPDQSQFGGVSRGTESTINSASAPPGLATAMREQLGLRLGVTKTSVNVLVIDHVQRPSEN
ncbi:MAG TPA: TIGR03435 family protein [Acidobacteriaceae bacterium]